MNTDVGRQLTALRAARGLSQETLAEHLGVSRQAVSNWERSESMPDTDNLLRLAEYYDISLDELTARAPQRQPANDELSLPAKRDDVSARIVFALCLLAIAAYFVWLAQPLLLSTVDDITEVFGLVPGTALAVAWFIGEVVFLAAPFLLMSLAPARMPQWAVALPLVVFAVLALPPSLSAALGGGPIQYSGIGGALKTSVVLKADALAVALACAALARAQRRRRRVPHATASS